MRPWHQGTNQSTPLVNLTYSQNIFSSSMLNNSSLTFGELGERMTLSYNDGTGSSISLNFGYNFYPGGVDVQNQTVLNWSRMYWMGLAIGENSVSNGSVLQPGVTFFGFDVVNESPQNVTFYKGSMSNGWSDWVPSNIVAALSYASADPMIGNVTLSTVPYEYQGAWLNESIATFVVTVNSTISAFGVPGTPGQGPNVSFPTVLSFRFVHTLNQTTYKYGADIDWGAAKDFPTRSPMSPGENYSLVEEDGLNLVRCNTSPRCNWTTITEFSTDPGNDTAFYSWNGSIASKEYFTRNYTLVGSSQRLNTTRIYMENATISNATQPNNSAIFVIYGGFQYDESSGLTFDPEVQTPSEQSGGPSLFRAINVSPPNSQVSVGGKETLHAGASCSPSPCPASTAYRWHLSSPLGSLSPTTGATVAFTAGNSTGGAEINVTVSWNGLNASASTEIAVVPATVNQSLVGLSIHSPPEVSTGQNVGIGANATCSGGGCPPGVNYTWNTSNDLGSIQPNNTPDPSFQAGQTPGEVNITLTARYEGVTLVANATIVILPSNLPSLNAVAISLPVTEVQVGHPLTANATPTCSPSDCGGYVLYSWSVNDSLGNLSHASAASVTLTAGMHPGAILLQLQATLGGNTQRASVPVTITRAPVILLESASVSPLSATVKEGATLNLSASATYSPAPCPAGIVYAWTPGSASMGSVGPQGGDVAIFTAGTMAGTWVLTVTAAWDGSSASATMSITVIAGPRGTTSSGPGITTYALTGLAVVALIGIAIAVYLRRERSLPAPPSKSSKGGRKPAPPSADSKGGKDG